MATDQNTRGSTLDTLFMIYWTVIVMVVVGMKILLSREINSAASSQTELVFPFISIQLKSKQRN